MHLYSGCYYGFDIRKGKVTMNLLDIVRMIFAVIGFFVVVVTIGIIILAVINIYIEKYKEMKVLKDIAKGKD